MDPMYQGRHAQVSSRMEASCTGFSTVDHDSKLPWKSAKSAVQHILNSVLGKRHSAVVKSCKGCRQFKLKCNIEKPCRNCIRRGREDECCSEDVKIIKTKSVESKVQAKIKPAPLSQEEVNIGSTSDALYIASGFDEMVDHKIYTPIAGTIATYAAERSTTSGMPVKEEEPLVAPEAPRPTDFFRAPSFTRTASWRQHLVNSKEYTAQDLDLFEGSDVSTPDVLGQSFWMECSDQKTAEFLNDDGLFNVEKRLKEDPWAEPIQQQQAQKEAQFQWTGEEGTDPWKTTLDIAQAEPLSIW